MTPGELFFGYWLVGVALIWGTRPLQERAHGQSRTRTTAASLFNLSILAAVWPWWVFVWLRWAWRRR